MYVSGVPDIPTGCTLRGVNCVLKLTGLVSLAVGLFVCAQFSFYDLLLSDLLLAMPKFIIFTGVSAYFTVIMGSIAARKEEPRLWNLYLGAMIVMLIFHLSTCITSFVTQDIENRFIWDQFRAGMKREVYGTNPPAMVVMDDIQKDFDCCGASNSYEWLDHLGTQETKGVPISCCDTYGVVLATQCTTENAHVASCGHHFGNFVEDNMNVMAYSSLILTVVQAFLLVLTTLAVQKKKQEWQHNTDDDMLTDTAGGLNLHYNKTSMSSTYI